MKNSFKISMYPQYDANRVYTGKARVQVAFTDDPNKLALLLKKPLRFWPGEDECLLIAQAGNTNPLELSVDEASPGCHSIQQNLCVESCLPDTHPIVAGLRKVSGMDFFGIVACQGRLNLKTGAFTLLRPKAESFKPRIPRSRSQKPVAVEPVAVEPVAMLMLPPPPVNSADTLKARYDQGCLDTEAAIELALSTLEQKLPFDLLALVRAIRG